MIKGKGKNLPLLTCGLGVSEEWSPPPQWLPGWVVTHSFLTPASDLYPNHARGEKKLFPKSTNDLIQRSTNLQPMGQIEQITCFCTWSFVGTQPSHLFIPIAWGCFPNTTTELRWGGPESLKYLLPGPATAASFHPWIRQSLRTCSFCAWKALPVALYVAHCLTCRSFLNSAPSARFGPWAVSLVTSEWGHE